MDLRPVRRALLSVSDKSGLIDFARGLAAFGVELVSTGGTRKALAEGGLAVRDVATHWLPRDARWPSQDAPPDVHGGFLARRDDPAHMKTIAEHGIAPIDLVVVQPLPVRSHGCQAGREPGRGRSRTSTSAGPRCVRSAAKNYEGVAVLTDPAQYAAVLRRSCGAHSGSLTLATRERLAAAAFARTAAYDRAIAAYFATAGAGAEMPGRRCTSIFRTAVRSATARIPTRRRPFTLRPPRRL